MNNMCCSCRNKQIILNNIVANKICVVSKIGLGTGIFGKMAVKVLMLEHSNFKQKYF